MRDFSPLYFKERLGFDGLCASSTSSMKVPSIPFSVSTFPNTYASALLPMMLPRNGYGFLSCSKDERPYNGDGTFEVAADKTLYG